MNIARRFGALALSGGTVGSLLVALDGEFLFFFIVRVFVEVLRNLDKST